MNTQIQKLSDIAYKNHLAKNPHSSFSRRSDYDKEFAELIVRECAQIADKAWAAPGYQIKQHFGVTP
jgi:hypothetical protein